MRSLHLTPAPATPNDGWARAAACRDVEDPDIFFPGRRDSAAAALAVCAVCPVPGACSAHALDTPEMYGVWGGVTEEERRADRRGRPASSARSRASAWLDLTPRARGA